MAQSTENIRQVGAGQWLISQPDLQPEPGWFEQHYWLDQGRLLGANSGRGSAWLVKSPHGKWMLRHYFRGGLPARVNRDKYFWRGLEKTRAIAEWRLLQRMQEHNLPVPKPVAARVRRHGCFYTADILMQYLPHEHTFGHFLVLPQAAGDLETWRRVGKTIGHLHQAGFFHADLNVHNILLSKSSVWLIDFDRGSYRGFSDDAVTRSGAGWRQANMRRLLRSVKKIVSQAGDEKTLDGAVLTRAWTALEQAYTQAIQKTEHNNSGHGDA